MENFSENKMGIMPMPKLLLSMSGPIMASMLVLSLYNVIDSIFVARLGENAITAVSLAFPVQILMISISTGTAVGINALLSRKLGEGDRAGANLAANNGVFLSLLNAIGFLIFGILFVKPYFNSFVGAGEVMDMGVAYTSIVSMVSFGVFFSVTGERLLQSTGSTIYSMYSQLAGAVTNIILDPILIFGLLGAPKLGVAGAAVATVAGQIVSMCICFYFLNHKVKDITLSRKDFKPNKKVIKEIYIVGFPSILMQAIGSLMTFGMNKILIIFSQTAVSVFGLYFKMQSFVFMPVFGLCSGMIPIVAFNYGARKKERIIHCIKLGCAFSLLIMCIGVVLFQFFSGFMLSVLFEAEGELLTTGIKAFRIISLHFPLAAISIVLSNCFQALGKGVYSLWISILRQLVVLLPSAFILGNLFNLEAVWCAFPIAETSAIILGVILFKRIYNNKIKTL